jgi:hypothetical protein
MSEEEARCGNNEPHEPHHVHNDPSPTYSGSWKGKDFCSYAYPTAVVSECHKKSHDCLGVPLPTEKGVSHE